MSLSYQAKLNNDNDNWYTLKQASVEIYQAWYKFGILMNAIIWCKPYYLNPFYLELIKIIGLFGISIERLTNSYPLND
jgi:hypothetical protein